MYTIEQVAAAIDHAVLKPQFTGDDVARHAAMCRERGVGCLCVRPCDVAQAGELLQGSSTKVCMVVGFPHGANLPEIKAEEARHGIEQGAVEVDMVMNVGRMLAGDEAWVQRDIEAVVSVAKPCRVVVKVILETCLLSAEQIVRACELARDAGANFVKTSTGFAGGGATPEAVDLMLKTVGDIMGVKASGGIRDWAAAVGYLEQGCRRLGVGSTEVVLDGGQAEGEY